MELQIILWKYHENEFSKPCTQSLFESIGDLNISLITVDNYKKLIDCAKNSKADGVYMVEDNQLHRPEAITELLQTWDLFTGWFGIMDIALCLTDDPINYKIRDGGASIIYGGINRAWRGNNLSKNSFCTTPNVINKYWEGMDWEYTWQNNVTLLTPLIPLAYNCPENHPYHPYDDLWEIHNI